MTQDCQTQQLSRQQVICQCQRPVTLHLTWQYKRNICDLHDSCHTQLLITWVRRAPRISVQIDTLLFSRGTSVSFFFGFHSICGLLKSAFYHSLPSHHLPYSSYNTLCCRRVMLPGRVARTHLPSYGNLCGTDIGWIFSHGDGEVHIWPLWANRECSPWSPSRRCSFGCLTWKDLSPGLITYLPYAKPNLCNMWGWTTLGTQTHKPFVRVYTSADSFAPRLSASRQKQDMWAEAQLLPDNISYSNLCRR